MSVLTRVASFTGLAVLFSGFVFFLFKVLVEDVLADYVATAIEQAIDITSLANAIVFIYTAGLIMAVFLSILLSDVDKTKGVFSAYLAGLMSIFIVSLISLAFLTVYYPMNFSAMNVGLALVYPNYYNMLFIVYVLHSADIYYVILFILIYGQALIYLGMSGAFGDSKKTNKHSRSSSYLLPLERRDKLSVQEEFEMS
jgi:hypothetical protein